MVPYILRPLQCLRCVILWPQISKNKTLGLNEAFEAFMKGFPALDLNSMVSFVPALGTPRWSGASEVRYGKTRLNIQSGTPQKCGMGDAGLGLGLTDSFRLRRK